MAVAETPEQMETRLLRVGVASRWALTQPEAWSGVKTGRLEGKRSAPAHSRASPRPVCLDNSEHGCPRGSTYACRVTPTHAETASTVGTMWILLALASGLFQVLRNAAMKRLGHALDEYINVWGRFIFV